SEWLKKLLGSMRVKFSSEQVLANLRERSGLIIGPGVYSFVHKSVAEFLVAESIVEGNQQDKGGQRIDRLYLLNHRDDDRWNTVTFLWAGLASLGDLEGFIDECITVNNKSLAFGLLYDQYEKGFQAHIKRNLTLKAFVNMDESDFSESMWFITPFSLIHPIKFMEDPNDEIDFSHKPTPLYLRDFIVRGLSSGILFFSRLVRKLTLEGIIKLEDRERDILPSLKDLIWVYSFLELTTEDDFLCHFEIPPPQELSEELWYFWAIRRTCNRTCKDIEELRSTNDDVIEESALQRKLPELKNKNFLAYSLIPIALFATTVEISLENSIKRKNEPNNLELLFLYLNDFVANPAFPAAEEVSDEWLLGTRYWYSPSSQDSRQREKAIDLLMVFLSLIEKFKAARDSKEYEKVATLEEYVSSLMDRRNSLEVD
ncbi:MAG: hypothetical protein F6K11_16720, partial [Leptolyngbya sp. SIO3F4]|nr:hypothetical protein [Leptolyngbya sp. SIO3F4]